jgi:hypothetical protein
MSYREIAAVMGCSSQYIRRIERTALRKLAAIPELKDLLEEYLSLPEQFDHWDEAELISPEHGDKYQQHRLYVRKRRARIKEESYEMCIEE